MSRYALPSDVPGYFSEPVGGMWLSDPMRSDATMSAEHRSGLHASDPCGDCSLCEASGLEQQGDPLTAHVDRRFVYSVDPWLASGEFVNLALGGFLHGAGGVQGDLVSLRHNAKVDEREAAAVVQTMDGAR